MFPAPLRQTSGSSAALDRQAKSPVSTWGRDRGLSVAIEASVRGDFGEDGWMLGSGKVPSSWWV